MGSAFEKAKRTYLKEIRRQIAFTGRDAKRYLNDLSARMEDFAEETGTADFSAVRERFGAPEVVAQAFLENTDPALLKKNLHVSRKVLIVLAAVLLLSLAIYGGIRLHASLHQRDVSYGKEEIYDPPEDYYKNISPDKIWVLDESDSAD